MFGFLHEREKKLSVSIYLKNRLYNYRGNFRKNITYLLHSALAVDLSHLKSEIRINMRIRKNARTVTAGDIRNCAYNDTLLQNSYIFMKNIRGTELTLEISCTIFQQCLKLMALQAFL